MRVRRLRMKLIYKPFGIIFGLLAGLLSTKIFNLVWSKIDDEDPPKATTKETPWTKLLVAAAVQGMIMKTVRVLVDRNGARGYEWLTGVWPGERVPDPK